MTIEEKDFKLELNELNYRFDLSLLSVINAKDPEKRREEFKLYGYGMSLENCFNVIINYRIDKKIEVIDLKTYVRMYKVELDKLSEELSKFKKGNV